MSDEIIHRCLVVPGTFLPYNDTITQLVYKQLRLLPFSYDVCALKEPNEDARLKENLKNDPNYTKFHVIYAGQYQDVLFSIKNLNLFKGLRNMNRYVDRAVKMYQDQDFLYTSSFPCYTTRVGVILKQKHPELKWIANFSDPINHSPYKYDRATYRSYSLPEKVAFKLYCRYYVVDQDEANAFEQADILVFICEEQRNFMIAQYVRYFGKTSESSLYKKSVIVPLNYVPEWNDLHPLPQQPHHTPFLLAHFGRIYGLRIIREFIYACDLFRKKHPDISLQIEQYGEFPLKDNLLIHKLHLQSIFSIHQKIPYADCIARMNESDAVLLFDTILPEDQIQPYLPSKIIEYSLLKKNTLAITTRRSPTYRIMKKSGAVVCPYERQEILKGMEAIIINHQSSLIDYATSNEKAISNLKNRIDTISTH